MKLLIYLIGIFYYTVTFARSLPVCLTLYQSGSYLLYVPRAIVRLNVG